MEDEEGDKIKRTTLVVKNVDPHWRNLFTDACKANEEDRGEVLTRLMRQVVENTYGVGGAERLYEEDIEYRAYLKERNLKRKFDEESGGKPDQDDNHIPPSSLDLDN